MADILFIHGAWQGAWTWDLVTPVLTRLGHGCYPVDLPGNGNGADDTRPEDVSFDLYMSYLDGRLEERGEPTVVVGHSSGGIMASQLAENHPGRVRGVVYVAGMMLPSGMAFAQLVEEMTPDHPEAAGIAPYLEWSEDGETSVVPPEAAIRIFLQDTDPAAAAEAAARLKPQPQRGRAIRPTLSDARFGSVPRAYIECTLDNSVVIAAQRRMQELVPGAAVYTLESGHAPLLSMPLELAGTIDRAIRDFGRLDLGFGGARPEEVPA